MDWGPEALLDTIELLQGMGIQCLTKNELSDFSML
jgi:hypothetical protein